MSAPEKYLNDVSCATHCSRAYSRCLSIDLGELRLFLVVHNKHTELGGLAESSPLLFGVGEQLVLDVLPELRDRVADLCQEMGKADRMRDHLTAGSCECRRPRPAMGG